MVEERVSQFSATMDFSIRPARESDLEKLEWFGEFEKFRTLFARSYREQNRGKRLMLIAETNDFPIGRLFLQFEGNNPILADGMERGYLYSFHVMEMFRGLGIGTRLITEGENALRIRDFRLVTLAVAQENERALQLYHRMGYQTFGDNNGSWESPSKIGYLLPSHEPCWLLKKELTPDETDA